MLSNANLGYGSLLTAGINYRGQISTYEGEL